MWPIKEEEKHIHDNKQTQNFALMNFHMAYAVNKTRKNPNEHATIDINRTITLTGLKHHQSHIHNSTRIHLQLILLSNRTEKAK